MSDMFDLREHRRMMETLKQVSDAERQREREQARYRAVLATVRGLDTANMSTPEVAEAILAKVPDATTDEMAAALREVGEEWQREAEQLQEFKWQREYDRSQPQTVTVKTTRAEPFDAKLAVNRIMHDVLSALARWPEERRQEQMILVEDLRDLADNIERKLAAWAQKID